MILGHRLKTSVVVCTFNGQAYINDQINSIISQTVRADEVILSDDCSEDDTVSISLGLLRKSGIDFQLIQRPSNLGYTRNFIKALQHASGDIIFFSDQDDRWNENKIEAVLHCFQNDQSIAGVTHDGRLVDKDLRWFGTTKNIQVEKGYGKNHRVVTGALSAIRKKYLPIVHACPEVVLGHDTWLTYVFSIVPNRWRFLDNALQDIRRHSLNSSDWIVNSFRKIGALDVLREQFSTAVASSYNDRIQMNNSLRNFISNKSQLRDLFSANEVTILRSYLEGEHRALYRRNHLAMSDSRLKRYAIAFAMLANRDYSYFNGFRSFLRDIAR